MSRIMEALIMTLLERLQPKRETAAAQAKEQEIANNSENPGGGTAGGENKKLRT